MKLINLLKVAKFIFQSIKTQKKFNEQYIDAYLAPFYKQFNKEIKGTTIYKIKKYYAIGLPLNFEAYLKIYGKKISTKERELAILMSVVIPLVDDFTDDKTLSKEAIDQLLFSSDNYPTYTLEETIVKSINQHLRRSVGDVDGFLLYQRKTINAQFQSEKQMEKDISRDELYKISFDKGGWSHVLYHFIIDTPPSKQAIDTMYALGGVLQMCNDIFDIYKDFKDGISTYASTCNNFKELETIYTQECRKFITLAKSLPYKKQDINMFITSFVVILARGIVALKMYNKLQKKLGGGVLPLDKIERKDIICDMDKPLNHLKTIWFALKM